MDFGGDKTADGLRIFTERPGVDDRIRRIVVHVGDGSERQVNPDRSPFECGDPAHLIGGRVAAGRAYAHIGRQRRTADQTDRRAAFEIGRDEQRKLGERLKSVELGRHVQRRADRDDEAADVERIDPLLRT